MFSFLLFSAVFSESQICVCASFESSMCRYCDIFIFTILCVCVCHLLQLIKLHFSNSAVLKCFYVSYLFKLYELILNFEKKVIQECLIKTKYERFLVLRTSFVCVET